MPRPAILSIPSRLAERDRNGRLAALNLQRDLSLLRWRSLAFSSHLELAPAHTEGVTTLSLDPVESRYLLSGGADASLAIYDVIDKPSAQVSTEPREPVAMLRRPHKSAHRDVVSSLQWFPHDTGAFVSAGADGKVKLWDTNELVVACEFTLPGRVHCIAMSTTSTTHTLIATATHAQCALQLCDPTTGSATHSITGHRAPPWVVCWSPRHEHQLLSGGEDRSIRVWDIRRTSCCLRSLDVHDTLAERKRLASFSREAPTTVAAARSKAGKAVAHQGSVTSLVFSPDGSMLLSAGRDHRMRLWQAESGVHMNVHFTGATTTRGRMKQIAMSSGGGLSSTRVFFPSCGGVHVYDLSTGKKLTSLKAHFGDTTCCVASVHDQRLFSGGEDKIVNVWSPPPCGIVQPAQAEQTHEPVALSPCSARAANQSRSAADLLDSWSFWESSLASPTGSQAHFRGATSSQPVASQSSSMCDVSSASTSAVPIAPAALDVDAWSDVEGDDELEVQRRRPRPSGHPSKRRRGVAHDIRLRER